MASPAPRRMTLAEFLDWDDGTDRRYQLVDGVPVMMAPTLEAHGELVVNLGAEIRSRHSAPCRVISEAGVTIPDRADTYYVADLAVTCAPREPGRRMVAEPVVIVEVLSPSTDQVDRWRKVADYRTLPSVREIVVVFSDERRVEVQRRTAEGWKVEDLIGRSALDLNCCAGPIPLKAIHPDLPCALNGSDTPNRTVQDTSLSINLLMCAKSYLSCAKLCLDSLDIEFEHPLYFLCGHAFELTFKAFLRASGLPPKKLQNKYGHDLLKLYRKAKEHGLPEAIDPEVYRHLDYLNGLMTPPYQARYPQHGHVPPDLPQLIGFCRELQEAAEPVCREALLAEVEAQKKPLP